MGELVNNYPNEIRRDCSRPHDQNP